MAKRTEGESRRSSERIPKGKREGGELSEDKDRELSLFEQLQAIARHHARSTDGLSNRLYLMSWWSQYYNRPLKDPVLMSYTLEELAYEYYLVGERAKYKEEQNNEAADKIEEERLRAAEDWADQMEAEEEEAERRAQQDPAKEKGLDPSKDPKNIEWMEQEIAKNKLLFGDDFGEDLKLDFEEGD